MKENITPIGLSVFRGESRPFGIKDDDRRRHVYIIGKTGVGKSTLLENMIINDIKAGYGVAFLDPHGESAEKILDFIPEDRIDDVIYINPADTEHPIAFNPLEEVSPDFRHLVASSMMGVFEKIWADAWSARMKYILNNALLALLEYPGTTLLGIQRMLNNVDYRKEIVNNLKDPVVKSFWVDEFAKYSQRFESEATAAIQNKVGQFISNPLIRNILGQAHSTIDMRKAMDDGKIIIADLSKGRIGEDNSALLGAMIITKLQLAAMSRVNILEKERRDFYLYVDEFQNFATESFASVLSEARKYRLSLIVANQYLDQLDHEGKTTVRSAIFGNVGTMVIFRIGAKDAEFVEKEFEPEYAASDLVNLAKYHIYIKLMIDGIASRPFAAKTMAPATEGVKTGFKDVIIENTRHKYAVPKNKVEEKIARDWLSTSEQSSGERAVRREEKPLRDVLKNQPRDYRPPRNPASFQRPMSFPPASNASRSDAGWRKRESIPPPRHSESHRHSESFDYAQDKLRNGSFSRPKQPPIVPERAQRVEGPHYKQSLRYPERSARPPSLRSGVSGQEESFRPKQPPIVPERAQRVEGLHSEKVNLPKPTPKHDERKQSVDVDALRSALESALKKEKQ